MGAFDADKSTDQPTAYDVTGGGDFKPLPATSTSPGQKSGTGGQYVENGPGPEQGSNPWKVGK